MGRNMVIVDVPDVGVAGIVVDLKVGDGKTGVEVIVAVGMKVAVAEEIEVAVEVGEELGTGTFCPLLCKASRYAP